MKTIVVNAMGDSCPIPVVKAGRALREMTEPGVLEVLVDNRIATENLSRMASGHGLTAAVEEKGPAEFVVRMEVPSPAGDAPAREPEPVCPAGEDGPLVVAVGDEVMGGGDPELGRLLMKSFLFAVGQLPQLPRTMIFYNAGAKLTVEGSAALEDLRKLEEQGVEILTCGTCLNFYHLTEKLAVGSVSNMYTIVETLASAGKVIRP